MPNRTDLSMDVELSVEQVMKKTALIPMPIVMVIMMFVVVAVVSGDGRGRLVQEGAGQKRGDERPLRVGFNQGIRQTKRPGVMVFRCCCQGKVRLDLVGGPPKSRFCLADGAAFELKGDIMVVHGEGGHAQEEAGDQEKPDPSPNGSADAIAEHLGRFPKHAAF